MINFDVDINIIMLELIFVYCFGLNMFYEICQWVIFCYKKRFVVVY